MPFYDPTNPLLCWRNTWMFPNQKRFQLKRGSNRIGHLLATFNIPPNHDSNHRINMKWCMRRGCFSIFLENLKISCVIRRRSSKKRSTCSVYPLHTPCLLQWGKKICRVEFGIQWIYDCNYSRMIRLKHNYNIRQIYSFHKVNDLQNYFD